MTIFIGSGFNENSIKAKKLKTVLSNNDEVIVDKLFLNQRYLFFVIFDKK